MSGESGGSGGDGYSASGATHTGIGIQQRFDNLFGSKNNSTGLQIPPWAAIVAVVLLFGIVVTLLVWIFKKN